MKKLLIIYRSGVQTTLEYDEDKIDLFRGLCHMKNMCPFSENEHFDHDEFIRKMLSNNIMIDVHEVTHAEVLK